MQPRYAENECLAGLNDADEGVGAVEMVEELLGLGYLLGRGKEEGLVEIVDPEDVAASDEGVDEDDLEADDGMGVVGQLDLQ